MTHGKTMKRRAWPLVAGLLVMGLAEALSGGLALAADANSDKDWKGRVGQLGKPAADDIVLTAVGDAIWNRKISTAKDPRLQNMFDVMRASDIAFLNFEQVLADSGYPTIKEISRAPSSIIDEFTWAGIDLVGLGNNHMLDFGPSGLDTTLKTLDTAGIKHAGAGMDLAQALQPALIERKGLKIALLSFLVAPNITNLGTPATETTPGVASIRGWQVRLVNGKAGFAPADEDLRAMETAIKDAHKTADVVAVTLHLHWGDLEAIDPEGKQLIARTAIDAGADIMFGHGPHVVNGVEFYKGKPIIYSMGNFAFQFDFQSYAFFPTSQKVIKGLMNNQRLFESLMVRMILSPQGKFKRMELLPLGLTKDGDPHFVAGADANSVLDRVKALSEPFGTTITRAAWYAVVDLPKTP
jgi:poly-gamma-glutamate capsule biosynthesis protein CapA/YwtB (metallophosphatase superfamily)